MEIIFMPEADKDLDYWIKTGNKTIIKKVTRLIASIQESPFMGIGKPEQLRHTLSGLWSRRINREHRMVYEIVNNKIIIHSIKGHY